MATFETQFLERYPVAEATMAFFFARPQDFDFRAGQSLLLTLIDPAETDSKGNQRTFSLASAPSDQHLMIATRMRDTAFKRTLMSMPRGARVRIRGPAGRFTLDADDAHDQRPLAMLAGGIGITPFRSMLRQAAHDALGRRLCLFYANRTAKDAPFLKELIELQQRNARYRFIATMTQEANGAWSGERGYVDEDMLARHLPDVRAPVYYIAGPPAMVAAMEAMLARIGVPRERIRKDEFFGY